MRNPLRVPALVVALVAATACASSPEAAPANQETTTVTVENRNFLDMNVYVLEGAQRVRLGTVPGVSTRTLEIPRRLVFGISSLRFQVDPIGATQSPISHEIPVTAGDEIRLVIPSS